MSETSSSEPDVDSAAPQLEVNFLDPAAVRFERMEYGGLRMTTGEDGEGFDHIVVYRAYPLSKPGEYIAIRIGHSELEQREIGMIRRLSELDPEGQELIEEALEKRYFVHTVEEIVSIREDMGYFYWVVETDKGTQEFPVPISPRHIAHVGAGGRLVIDIDGNRYGIPDLEALDVRSQALFHRHIYW